MSVASVSGASAAINLKAANASAAAASAKSAEEAQESSTERQKEVSGGEESGSSTVKAAQANLGSGVNVFA